MIVVRASLISSIDSSRDASLGYLTICNDGSGTGSVGNYDVTLYSRGRKPRKLRTARIEGWPRNSRSAWDLVVAAVESVKK